MDGLDELLGVRPWALPDSDLLTLAADAVARLDRYTAALLPVVREIDSRRLSSGHGARSTAVLLRNQSRVSIATARKLVRRAADLDTAPPVLADAVLAGDVRLDQADVVMRTVTTLDGQIDQSLRHDVAVKMVDFCHTHEPALLEPIGRHIVRTVAPDVAAEIERRAFEQAEALANRDRYLTIGATGILRGQLTPEQTAIVRSVIQSLARPKSEDTRTPGQRRADALTAACSLAQKTTTLPNNGGDRPQIVVTFDYEKLKAQIGVGTLDDGTPISAAAARRIACDAGIIPMILGSRSQPLDLGRRSRLYPAQLRRALVHRDGGCTFPDCDSPHTHCDAHHLRHWANGGPTSLTNGALMCPFHHHLIHDPDSGWTVQINPADGLPEFTPPPHVDPRQITRRNRYHRRQ